MNIQDIIAQAQAAASPTIQPAVPTGNTPVPAPSLPTPEQAYAIQASQSTGQGAESADALEHDLRNLNALQLMQKYGYEMGQQMATQRAVATQQVANDLTTSRTTSQLAGDVVSDVGAGAVNVVGGIAAMGAGLVSRDAGTALAGTMKDFNEFVRNNQSPAQRAAQRNVQARDVMAQRDSKQQMDREIAEGSNETSAALRRVLRDIGNSIINTGGNSTALGSLVAQGIGSTLPIMGVSGIAGAIKLRSLSAAVKSGALTKAEATALMSKGTPWVTAGSIGAMEAGGAYQQAVSQVMGMPDSQLVTGSQEYRTLLEQGVDPSEAKKIIANKAGLAAAGMTAPFAIVLGRTVAKFEANPLAGISLAGAARNIGMQTWEEASQGGVSQLSSNTAIQAFADENQERTTGVGGQIGTGALAGAGMVGVMQAPGILRGVAAPALQATARGAANLAKSLSPEIPSEVLPPAVQPTLSMPTVVKQAGEVLQQAPAVTERMVQEIQASNATLEEKTQQLSLVQQMNQGISYSPDEFDASPLASVVPELKESLAGSTNLLEAIQATGNTLLGGKLEPQKAVAAVTYLDQLLSQAEAYAGSAAGDALITQARAATTDTDAQAFLSAMGQVFQNMETSTELNQYREQARKTFEKQAAPTEVNADTSPEIVSRATHAPHTLQHATVQDLLAQHDAGTIQLSDAQVMRLRGAAALTQAMDSLGAITEQGSMNPIVVVTRQVAFNPEEEENQKYPSVAQHHQEIVNALAKNDLERAKKGMADLGNLAQTFNNKVAALNKHIAAGPSSEHVKYENWVPNHGWRESAKGMYYLPRSSQSRVFAPQVAAETMLAVGAYNNLAEQFNTLEATPIPLVQLDQRARTAATPSKAGNNETAPPAPTTPSWEEVSPTPPLPPALPWEEATPPTPSTTQVAPVTPATTTAKAPAKKEQSAKPGQKAISKLPESEIMKRLRYIEKNNTASSLANNTVYQALRNELKLRSAAIEAANKQRQRESKKLNDPNSSAKAKVAPNANRNTEGGVVTGPKDAPVDTAPDKLPWEASAGNQPVPYIAKSVIDAVGQTIREGKNDLKAELNLVTALSKLVGLKHLVSTVRSRRDGEPQGGLYEYATSAIGLDDNLKGAPRIAVLLHEFGHHITYSKVAEYLGVDIETVTQMSEKELLAAFSEIAPGVAKEYNDWLKERKAQGAVTIKSNSQGKPTPYVPRSMSAMSRTYMAQIAGEDGNRPLDGADGNALRYSQFSEWLADNIGKVLESNAKSQSVIGKLFESIANAFRTVFAELTGNPELKKYIAAKSVQEWVQELMDRSLDAAPKTNPVSLEETFKGLMNEAEALIRMPPDEYLNASPIAYKLMADLEDALTSLVEHTRTFLAEGLLEEIKRKIALVAQPGKGRSWDATDFHGLALRAQYHLKHFTAQTAESSEAPPAGKAPPPSAPGSDAGNLGEGKKSKLEDYIPQALINGIRKLVKSISDHFAGKTHADLTEMDSFIHQFLQETFQVDDFNNFMEILAERADAHEESLRTGGDPKPVQPKNGFSYRKVNNGEYYKETPTYVISGNGVLVDVEFKGDSTPFGIKGFSFLGSEITLFYEDAGKSIKIKLDPGESIVTLNAKIGKKGIRAPSRDFLENMEGKTGNAINALFNESSSSVATSTPKKVILSGKTQHVVKDQKKADKANKFIGRGSSKSSTNQYAQDFGDAANTGVYSADDVVFLSVEGNRTGRLPLDRSELKKATDAGATIITDIEADRNRPYNIGEREAAEFLAKQGYVEVKPGEWKKPNTSQGTDAESAITPSKENLELNMVNSLAAALGLPAIKEIGDNPEFRGADYYAPDNRMRVDPRLKGNSRISMILLEMGHHAAMNVLANRLGVTAAEIHGYSDEQMLEAFRDNFPEVAREYDQWLQERRDVLTRDLISNALRTPISRSALAKSIFDFLFKGKGASKIFGPKKPGVERTRNSGFHMWLADNIGKALEENQTTQGIVGQFFKRVANAFRKLYAAVMADPELKNFAPAASVQEWLQKVLDRSINAEVTLRENQAQKEPLPWETDEEFTERTGEKAAPTAPKTVGTFSNPIVGDLWAMDGVKVVSTNLGGIHGRGLAKQAADKGLISRNNVDFESSPKTDVITLAVKGRAPETAKIPGRAFSEQVTAGNVDLLKSELNKLIRHARQNPTTNFYLPYVGLGFGEGDVSVIGPILEAAAREPNIHIVSKDEATVDRYAGSFAPGVRRDGTTRKTSSQDAAEQAEANESEPQATVASVTGASPIERAARLLKSNDGKENLFVRLFKLRGESTRLTTLEGDAYDAVMDALSSPAKFQAFTGSKDAPPADQLAKAAEYFRTYGAFLISNARELISGTDPKNPGLLNTKVPVKGVNMTRLQVLQAIQAGEKLPQGVTHPDTWKEGLGAINTFVDPENGSLDEYFLTAAGIAAAQWLLTSGGKGVAKYSEKMVAEITGIDIEDVTDELRAQVSAGFSHLDLIRGIADQIERYLGVEVKDDVPLFRAQSLSSSLAVLMLESMVSDAAASYYLDTVTLHVNKFGQIIGKTVKTYEGEKTVIKLPSGLSPTSYKTIVRYIPVKPVQVTPEMGFSSVMDQLLKAEPENALYFDKDQLEVSHTQLRSSVPLTKADKASQAKLQETPHKLNPHFAKLIKLLPVDALKKILGGEVSEDMNKNHAASVDGKGVTVSGSRNQVDFVLGEIATQAQIQGKEPYEVEVFYKYEVASQGRAMMQGKYNPQSDKVMRNLVMPMISTLDLNDTEHRLAWDIASLQMLGERTFARQPHANTARAQEVFGNPAVQEAIAVMQRVLQDEAVDADEIVQAMQKAAPFLKDGATPEAMHVLLDRARFQMADDVSAFESRLYLEADGVANGPAGAMAMMFSGGDLVEYVRKMRKAGFFIGEPEMVMANHRQRDSIDLYATSGDLTAKAAAERLAKYGETGNQKKMKAAHLFVIELMAALFPPGSIIFKDGMLEIDRSVSKNPMTITVYGSGAKGIAGKLLGIIESELYERMTEAMRTGVLNTGHLTPEEFKGLLEYLTTNGAELVEAKDKDTGKPFKYWTMTYRGESRNNFLTPDTFKEFTFNANERKALKDNIHHFFVKDMVKGIEDTVGQSVMKNTKAMIAATTIQNHMVQHAFNTELEKLYAQKRSENPEWDPVIDGLSKKDYKALEKSLDHLNIALRTEKQEWEVGSSEKATAEGIVVTKSPFKSNRFQVPAIMRQPGGAGVQVVPYLVMGMGDAAMVQNLQNDPNAPTHLEVFDGINLGLNDIKNGGAVVNKAMADAWLNNNPLQVVADSLLKALTLGDWAKVFADLNTEDIINLERSLSSLGAATPEDLHGILAREAKNVDRIHKAIQEVGFASDQMAATGVAHVAEGTVNSDNEQDVADALNLAIANQLNTQYLDVLTESRQGNLNIFEGEQIQRLVKAVVINNDLRILAQRALDTNLGTTLKDMKVVVGSVGDLQAGGHVPNAAILEGLLNGSTKGFWNPQTRTLVMLENFTEETLTHELEHAATLDVLYAHISDKGLPRTKWGDAVTASIIALENIFTELVEDGWDVSRYSDSARRAYQDMMATIHRELGSLEAGLEAVPAAKRMNALNEMMAWATTNQRVKEISKLQKFKQVITAAIGLLKSILFGPDANNVPRLDNENVFQQINFHTQALMHANGELERRQVYGAALAQDTLQHSASYGNDGRLADIGKSFHQRVGQYLAARGSLAEQVGKKVDVKSASVIAAGVRVAVQSLGMVSKPQEAAAFTKIVQAMATQAQIDPLVLNEAQSLYKQAVRGLKVEHFLENENDQDPANLQAAENKLNFILGRGSVFTDSVGRSSLLPVFIGLGLTDPTVRMALAKVNTESGKQRIAGSIDDKLTTAANNVMRALQDKLVNGPRNPKNVNDALDSLAQTLIDDSVANANLIERMGGAVGNVVDFANQQVVNALSQGSRKVSAKASSIAAGTRNRALKAAAQTVSLTANIFNEEGAAANAEAMIRSINKSKMPELVRSVVKDLTGRTKSNAGVYDMIKIASSKVSKVRQFYKEQLPSTLQNAFKKQPSTEQWTAMFKGMAKVDLASLVPGVSQANAFAAFDKAERTKQIAALEQTIKADPEAKRILQKAKQLANYMVTGEAGPALLANADAVAHIIHDRVGNFRARKVEKSKTFVDQVDRLITLYALDQTPQDTLDAVVELNKQEPEAMKQILGVLKAQRETDQARRQGAARFNAMKGYIPSVGSDGASLVVENDKNMAEMKRKGYIRVANYTGSTIFQGSSMGYYFSPVSGKAPYNQGIFQNARLTSGGVDVGTGFAVGFPTAGRITQKTTVERLAKNMHADTSKEALRPIFAEDGSIIAFERSIDPAQLQRLNPSTHLALMLGQWMGRQAEEELAHGVNLDAMARVFAMWKNESATRRDEYINVLDPNQVTDPVMRDALSLMPKQVRDEAERLFGKNTFMVRRDAFEDLFGYRDASFSDFWTGNSRWSPKTQETVRKLLERVFGPNALITLMTYENRTKNVIKDVKTLIVVKSVVVPALNLVANIFQMMATGVPLSVIIRGIRDKTLEVDAYMKSNLRKMDLQVELLAAKGNVTRTNKLTAQIQSIEDSHRRLSIWPLIEAGEFGSISDVGISRDELLLSEGKLQEYLEAKTEKLPQGLKTAGKIFLLTKDTALFQGMQKAMEYGDFLAKAIVYDHQRSKGMSKADALGMITDEFVNYDRLPGRVRGSLENFGLAWFWNYKLRIAKTAFRMIRQDPVRVALLAMLPMSMESPVSENVFTKLVEGNLGYSLGPEMAFDSIGLNPWINAMN